MTRPNRVRNARIRVLEKGGAAAWLQDRSSGWVYYTWRWVAGPAARHPRTTGALLVFWFLWGSVGLAAAVLLFGVLSGLAWAGWVALRSPKATGGIAKASVEDAKAKAALRKQWPKACRATGLLRPEDHEPPKLAKLAGNGHGTLTARVSTVDSGVIVSRFMKAAPDLPGVLGCREVVVSEKDPGTVELAFHWRDVLGQLVTLADLPASPEGHLTYGRRGDKTPASFIATQSVLIGGLTRKGKSNFGWAALADAISQGIYVDLYVSDPKGGVELDLLEARVPLDANGVAIPVSQRTGPRQLLEVREYAKTPAETVKMLDRAEKAMHARQYEMKQNGTRKIQPSAENPLVVIMLDETLPLTELLKKGTDSPLGRIAYTGSAAAFVIWANTQVGQVDSLGRFRDLVPQRVCFATGSPTVTDAVLGTGAEGMGALCSKIGEAGRGFSYNEGDRRFRGFKAAYVSDDEARLIAAGQLPPKVVNARREAYDRKAELSTASKSRKDRRTALYRWYYEEGHPEYEAGTLGYIGISYDVLRRESEHDAALRAFMEGNVRREVVWYDTRPEAEAAEREAILAEKPVHNRHHNRNNPAARYDKRGRDRLPKRRAKRDKVAA